ncbi:MAG: O-antigen translocase [Pseudomonadota bacterium]
MSEQSSHRQILISSAIIGGASVINILIGLLRMKIVAILLGPAGIGLIGILQNMITTASIMSAIGFGNVGTRQIAEANGRGDQAAIDASRRALFWGTLILAVIGGVVFWALRDILASKLLSDAALASTVGWLALGVALTVATGSQRALLNGMRRIGDIARVTVLSSIFSTLLGVPLIFWLGNDGLLWFILVAPLGSFIMSHLFVAGLPSIQSGPTPIKVLSVQWRTMARLGFAFMVAGLAGTVGQLVVRTLVQSDLGSEQLGYFQAAWVISMTYIGFVLGAMGTDYYPRLTAVIHDSDQTNRLVNEQSEVAVLLAGPVLLAMLALAPWVIKVLYSAEFAPAVKVLRWQILGDVLKIVSWPLGFVILAAGAGRTHIFAELSAMLTFAVATWWLLPLLGIEATGLSFFIMYVVYLPLVYWLARRRTSFCWSKTVLRDLLLLFTLALLVALTGMWHDVLGVTIGLVAASGFGIMALIRLATMASLGGPIGRLATCVRRFLLETGIIHE